MGDVIQKDQPKKKKKTGVWVHFLLWGVMVLFLFVAPEVKDRVTIVIGKPVSVEATLPESTDVMRYMVDRLSEVKIDGQRLYRVQGWSFLPDETSQPQYEIYFVLVSDRNRYTFKTTPDKRTDVELAFPEVEADLSKSGYDVLIARETLDVGQYDIGILYLEPNSGETIFQTTDSRLIRTMNKILLEKK
jgi:hypothetical protein